MDDNTEEKLYYIKCILDKAIQLWREEKHNQSKEYINQTSQRILELIKDLKC